MTDIFPLLRSKALTTKSKCLNVWPMASAMTSISNYDSSPFMIAISREMSDDPFLLALNLCTYLVGEKLFLKLETPLKKG